MLHQQDDGEEALHVRLLVDGGIANNLPIDEARKLCADVVIAVNISTPPLKRSEITSALSVAAQLVNFLGKQTVDDQLKSLGTQDVLIAPDLDAAREAEDVVPHGDAHRGEGAEQDAAGNAQPTPPDLRDAAEIVLAASELASALSPTRTEVTGIKTSARGAMWEKPNRRRGPPDAVLSASRPVPAPRNRGSDQSFSPRLSIA